MKKQISIQSFDASKMYNKAIIIDNLKREINKLIEESNNKMIFLNIIDNNDFDKNSKDIEFLKKNISKEIDKTLLKINK